jgi:hypothetical protein
VVFLSFGREAEGAVGQAIAKMKSLGGSVRDKLDAHPDFAFRRSEMVARLRAVFGFHSGARQPKSGRKAGERPEEESPVGPW